MKSSSYRDTRCRIGTLAESGRGDREYQQYALKDTQPEDIDCLRYSSPPEHGESSEGDSAELGADLVSVSQVQPGVLTAHDLIGFGFGIYAENFHQALLHFGETLPTVTEKQAFVVSTCGVGGTRWHAAVKELLANRGFSVLGDFSCKGWDTNSFLKLFGGINRGRPNEDDLEEARGFARGLK